MSESGVRVTCGPCVGGASGQPHSYLLPASGQLHSYPLPAPLRVCPPSLTLLMVGIGVSLIFTRIESPRDSSCRERPSKHTHAVHLDGGSDR